MALALLAVISVILAGMGTASAPNVRIPSFKKVENVFVPMEHKNKMDNVSLLAVVPANTETLKASAQSALQTVLNVQTGLVLALNAWNLTFLIQQPAAA